MIEPKPPRVNPKAEAAYEAEINKARLPEGFRITYPEAAKLALAAWDGVIKNYG